MKILFNQGTPVPLQRHLTGHIVDTVFERGWPNLDTGELLDAAERDGYGLLITTDQNLKTSRILGVDTWPSLSTS